MNTLTGQEWLTHPDPWARGYATMMKVASERRALRKRENARELGRKEIPVREQRLQKITPAAAPRLNLAKHLQVRAPVAEHDAASLIKSLHRAGGAPLTPHVPALHKVDAVPPVPTVETDPPALDLEQMTEGEAWALRTQQENEAREEVSALMRQALTGPGLAIGGQR